MDDNPFVGMTITHQNENTHSRRTYNIHNRKKTDNIPKYNIHHILRAQETTYTEENIHNRQQSQQTTDTT